MASQYLKSHPQPLIFPEGRFLLSLAQKRFTLFVTLPTKIKTGVKIKGI